MKLKEMEGSWANFSLLRIQMKRNEWWERERAKFHTGMDFEAQLTFEFSEYSPKLHNIRWNFITRNFYVNRIKLNQIGSM